MAALADPATGLAAAGAKARGLPWQEPDGGWADSGRTDLHVTIDSTGRTDDRRADFAELYGDWDEVAARIAKPAARQRAGRRAEVLAALRSAERDPAGLTDGEALALLDADGPELEALAGLADSVRADMAGDAVSFVVTRNINFTNVCYTGCRFCAFAQRRTDADAYTLSMQQVADRAEEAWQAGATEVCMQGGIHPDLPVTAYFDLAARSRPAAPTCTCTRSPRWRSSTVSASTGLPVSEWLSGPRRRAWAPCPAPPPRSWTTTCGGC